MNITPACFGNKDPETTACSGCEWEATCGLGILGQLKQCRSELSTLKAEVLEVLEDMPPTDEDGFCVVCVEYDGKHAPDCILNNLKKKVSK